MGLESHGPEGGWPARSLVGQLPGDLRTEFLKLGVPRRFGRGEVLIREGDDSTEVYAILRGVVRVVNHTAGGDEAVIAMATAGDLVGEFAALDGQPRTSTVIAAATTDVRVIGGARLRAFVAENPTFGRALACSVVAKVRAATRLRVETGQVPILTRVARMIVHLIDLYGRPVHGGVLLDIPLPQRALASLVAASERGVGRAYQKLRSAGAIRVYHSRVLVRDRALVQVYAEGPGGTTG